MVTDNKGNIIRNETQVSAGDEIKITLAKGKLSASINQFYKKIR